jgi:signal transduction histidine kinase
VRVHVPPRDVASLVILRAITRAGWLVAGVLLVATAVLTLDAFASRGLAQHALAPVGFLFAQVVALVLLYLRPRPRTAIIFVVVSVICIAGFQHLLFTTAPFIDEVNPFLLNRPIVALCAIGAVTGRAIGGIQWTIGALIAGELASVIVQVALDRSVTLGVGPLLAAVLVVTLMLWVRGSANNQSHGVPDERQIDEETLRLEQEREAEERAAAVIHDTVLSDLAAIVHGRVVLTENDQRYLRDNMRRLTSAMADSFVPTASSAVDLGLLGVVKDLQWRGLSVEISGAGSALSQVDSETRTAALGAIRAVLENVLVHAETSSADVFIDDNPDEVMVMIADQGKGFVPEAVGSDRLGLRLSIVRRIEDCGGRATLWSQPGVGTTVVLSLPKRAGDVHAI